MRRATIEYGTGARYLVRIHDGRADGWPQPELVYVGHQGTGRQVVAVGRHPKVVGVDVVYQLDESAAGRVFLAAVDRGVVGVDYTTGLALVQPGGGA